MFTQRVTRTKTRKLRRKGNGMMHYLSEQSAAAGERLQAARGLAMQRSQDAWRGTTNYMSQHPVASVGIALALGYALGLFSRRP